MTARDRIVLMVVAGIAIVAAFWFLALKPKREEVTAAEVRIASAKQRLGEAEGKLSDAKAAKSKYRENYATVASLGKAVPVDANLGSLIYQIQAIARANDINFQGYELKGGGGAPPAGGQAQANAATTGTLPPGAAVGAAGFPTMPFTFTFRGSFFKLQDFLADINSLTTVRKKGNIRVRGRLLQVDGIGLQAGPDGFPNIEARVSATGYVLPEDEGLTAGGTPSSPTGENAGAMPDTSEARVAR